MIHLAPHPALYLGAFETRFARPLGQTPSPDWLLALLEADAAAPLARSEAIRGDIRDLLRHGGYKPTGRGKPASEYLVKAAGAGKLSSINAAVDACNAVSLHSGLPISLVDLDRAEPPLSVEVVAGDLRYAFNPSGQEIRLEGLLCLHDRHGPCANGVKDSQRTKTTDASQRVLSLIWGCRSLAEHTDRAVDWYRELLGRLGATTEPVRLATAEPR